LGIDRLASALELREKVKATLDTNSLEIPLEVLQEELQDLHIEELSPGILQLTLDHGKVNEMGKSQLREFEKFILWANQQRKYHVLIIQSNKEGKDGSPIFQAGADFMERVRDGWTAEEKDQHTTWQRQLMAQFQRIPMRTIAVAHGKAMGWGTEFLGLTDVNIGTPELEVALPETGLGIIPGAGGSGGIDGLERKIGSANLQRLALNGETLTGEGLAGSLLSEVLPTKEAAYNRAVAIAKETIRRSPTSIRAFKLCSLACQGLSERERTQMEQYFYRLTLSSGDAVIGAEHAKEFRAGTWPTEDDGWNPAII
jgi:enoyl-CoA hydratase/carnithine racemase